MKQDADLACIGAIHFDRDRFSAIDLHRAMYHGLVDPFIDHGRIQRPQSGILFCKL